MYKLVNEERYKATSDEDILALRKMTVRQLKQKCRDASLKVSGTKRDIIMRLCGLEVRQRKTKMSVKEVNVWLEKQGVVNIRGVSKCLRAGMRMGFIDISGDNPLDNVVVSGACYYCGDDLKATIRDLLYQPDYAGHDYECTGYDATVKCLNEECEVAGVYVTGMCRNSAEIDSGKSHNHCTICPNFGTCMGDYREDHCRSCSEHFYSCRGLFRCECKGPNPEVPVDEYTFCC
ncbi:uncharacterized protein LOC117104938 [Anneissia japonica]|uniref:uncharacterized protein LOC117104938 n=1 Tax=Anneissia japonica TaxID=1529436 RepID=UPI0014256212|nr:uncharacterized protein LOC117104938 [Anneissia japonica]